MLKIKDNVDLKELERFGMVFIMLGCKDKYHKTIMTSL